MVHPNTELKFINDEIGHGVFATEDIPMGAMIYVKDLLDIEITTEGFEKYPAQYRAIIDKFAYQDQRGIYIFSWDHAKNVNHCCYSNSLLTRYGFDIATEDIKKGQEVTCDYGLLNVTDEMNLVCSKPNCRGTINPRDLNRNVVIWDDKIQAALKNFFLVSQPLSSFLGKSNLSLVEEYVDGKAEYLSVSGLRYEQ